MPRRRKRIPRGVSHIRRGLLAVSGGVTLVLGFSCLFFGWYALPRYSNRLDIPPITLLLSSPRYVAVNEEEEVRVALKNTRADSVQAIFRLDGGSTIPVFIGQSGTNIFMAGTIRGAEQIERKVTVFIPYDFGGGQANDTLGKRIGLTLWGGMEGCTVQQIALLPLSTAPMPWPRRLFGASFSMLTGVFVWFAKEWWDTMKQARGKAK